MVSGGVTIPSAQGTVSFTVSGAQNLAYANNFFSGVSAALHSGELAYRNLSSPGDSIPGYTHGAEISTIEQQISSSGDYTLPADTPGAATYTFVNVAGSTTISGSGDGDNLLVASGDSSASATYIDEGGNNIVNFVDGNNIYRGDLAAASASDTVIGGSGDDTISSGSGHGVVLSGSGTAYIKLQDTIAAGATDDPKSIDPSDYNQFVYLNQGTGTTTLDGTADVAVAATPTETIDGGSSGTDLVALVSQVGSPSGSDSVDGTGGATLSVYDATDGNHVTGGSGPLAVVFADSVSGVVTAGSGSNVVYGNAADTITLASQDTASSFIFVAGNGAGESVDGSASSGLVMVLGTGNETLTGGTATRFNANYDAATGLTGSITIDHFGGTDVFNFVGYTTAQYQAALATGTQTGGNYQITLSDNTKVTFIGVTTLTGHTTSS